ncbi:MAG TPA: FtsX-like permease family protein, partial [Longimicrobiales bacterium]|nr:FtsX-like permease family protein [Longimicrobiales bacterium]
GMRLLRGRGFREADEGATGLVAVIDDVLADRFFPGGSAVGGRLWSGGDTATIVGVVDQARLYDVHRDDRGQVYFPSWMDPDGEIYVVVRAGGDPTAVAAAVRVVLRRIDPAVPVSEVRTMASIVQDSLREERLDLSLVASFALAALLLAGLGVYGVVANGVVQRHREIGLRMAVGAAGRQVTGMVLADSFRLVAVGLGIGLAGVWATSRFLSGLLYGVRPFDPWTWAAVVLLLGAVAMLAAWLPARRATGIDPCEALRSEYGGGGRCGPGRRFDTSAGVDP